MNEVVIRQENIPSRMEDLSRFVLVGREKLVAVRAEIRAIEKVGLAQEVREQKLREAQDISEAVLDAEVRIGELMAKVPKATTVSGNQYTGKWKNDTVVDNPKSKADVIRDAGFTPKQVQRFQTLAAHPEIVEQAKAEARENDDIISRAAVLNKIRDEIKQPVTEPEESAKVPQEIHTETTPEHKPHVSNNSGNNEWYTPKKYVDAARRVLGSIDLDPASCAYANETVQAERFYSVEDDGLTKEWRGRVWMNPPYNAESVVKFTENFVDEYEAGHINEGIVLVNNATETSWFVNMVNVAAAIVFPRGRIRYESSTRDSLAPLQGQAFLYFGENIEKFFDEFSEIGWGAVIR